MAIYDHATENRNDGGKQKYDRLSSLPDDILIRILSDLPLRLAITTGCLSQRWRGLWTNRTYIKMSYRDFKRNSRPYEFHRAVDEILTDITSPFVHTFSVEFLTGNDYNLRWCVFLDSWLRQVCDLNVRELTVISHPFRTDYMCRLPSYIFQTRSLSSLELDTTFGWQLPDDGPDLPNLKNLSINLFPDEWNWLEQLIKACPSLVELSIKGGRDRDRCFECSNNNVTRLILNLGLYVRVNKVVINTPLLEYLHVRGLKYETFSFQKEPIALGEVKIDIIHPSRDREIVSKFYQAICDVKILTLNASSVHNITNVFPNLTRLTLEMDDVYEGNFVSTVSTLVKLCPILDVLTLQFWDIGDDDKRYISKCADVRPPFRVIKRIEIKTRWQSYCRPSKSSLKLPRYLLRNATDLEHFHFKVAGEVPVGGSVKRKRKRELDMCKRLYRYQTISTTGCEVKFAGRFLNMSREAGPKAWTANGEVIPFEPKTI